MPSCNTWTVSRGTAACSRRRLEVLLEKTQSDKMGLGIDETTNNNNNTIHLQSDPASNAPVNSHLTTLMIRMLGDDYINCLTSACDRHNYDRVRSICTTVKEDLGYELRMKNPKTGKSPLHHLALECPVQDNASRKDWKDTMQWLASMTQDSLQDRCDRGYTFLHYACRLPLHKTYFGRLLDVG